MQKIYSSNFLILILLTGFSFAQQETTIHTLDFETQNTNNSLYTLTDEAGTPLSEYSDGSYDYFSRTNGSNISGEYITPQGTYFFAAQDIDGEPANIGSNDIPFDMTISNIDISQSQGLGVRILLAEDDDGSNQDWDNGNTLATSDYFKIFYIIDSGTKTEVFSVRASGNDSSHEPRVDTDNDGIGDGTAVTDTFTEFEFSIDASGSSMTLVLSFNLNSGDEDIAIDNLRVVDGFTSSGPTPIIEVSSGLSVFDYILGSGPSVEKSFTVSGADLTNDIVVTPPSNYEISESSGTGFDSNAITLTQINGDISSTTLYARLKSGLTTGDYIENINVNSTGAVEKTIRLSGSVYPAPSQDLFFSEYAHGSGNNKYLEIYNPTNDPVSLDGYAYPSVGNGSNGAYEYWNSFDGGALIAAGDVYIIAHSQASQTILDESDEYSNYLSNGNDGYALAKGSETSFQIIDRIGDFGDDPGNGWAVAGVSNATKENTLVRKISVTQGNPVWSASSGSTEENSEWVVLEKDTFTFLGSHPHTEAALSIFDFDNQVVKVYPNPVETKLNFSGLTSPVQATVFDMLGKRQLQSEVTNSLDVSQLKSGLYMVEIKNENSAKVFNILKK